MSTLPSNFWKAVEQKGFLTRVIYSDTDSIFILLDEFNWKTGLEAGEIAIATGDAINNSLKSYYDHYLRKIGVDVDNWYFIDFKTETAMESQIYTAKKYYAYNLVFELKKSGPVAYVVPELHYKGLPLKKSDTSKLVKDFMEELLILALSKTDNKYKKCNDIAKKYYNLYEESLKNYDYTYIARPSKNTGKPNIITGCRLYNTLVEHEEISKGQSILAVHMDIANTNILKKCNPNFLKPADYDKLNYFCFPYNKKPEELKELLNKYNITIMNEFKPMRNEKRPRMFGSTTGEDTPIMKIIDAIKEHEK